MAEKESWQVFAETGLQGERGEKLQKALYSQVSTSSKLGTSGLTEPIEVIIREAIRFAKKEVLKDIRKFTRLGKLLGKF